MPSVILLKQKGVIALCYDQLNMENYEAQLKKQKQRKERKKRNPKVRLIATAVGLVVYLIVFQLLIWPVLNQEGKPVETLMGVLTLTLKQGSYYQLSDQPESYLIRKGQVPVFLKEKGLVETDQMGAMHYFKRGDQKVCALGKVLTHWFGVYEFRACD